MRILVVDDEPAVREALERALHLDGYDVQLAANGREALAAVPEADPDAVVLDVLMLTARDAVADRVAGLDAGADDYLVKPFALEELLARLRALLRRHEPEPEADAELAFGDLRLDLVAYEAWRGERQVQLTRTEWLLLELFVRNPRRVLSRAVIFDRVWGYDFGPTSKALEVYVGYLRRKTEAGGEPRLLHTVRSVGYILREP